MPVIGTAKDWLEGYRDLSRTIDLDMERLERLREKATSPAARPLDGVPHGGHVAGDNIGVHVIALDNLEAQIRDKINVAAAYQAKIEEAIARITGRTAPDMRAAIRSRYLDGFTWAETSELLYGHNDDFQLREESYLRRTLKTHSRALDILDNLIKACEIETK